MSLPTISFSSTTLPYAHAKSVLLAGEFHNKLMDRMLEDARLAATNMVRRENLRLTQLPIELYICVICVRA